MSSSTIAHHKSRVAAFTRSRTPDDPELVRAKQDLAEAKLADYIQRLLDAAPELSDEQRVRLAELLKPARGGA